LSGFSSGIADSYSEGGPIGIPSFFWGCAFNIIGVVIVYVITEDTKQSTMALWGCILNSIFLGGGFWWLR
jgi:hypothetical protein